MSKKLKVKEYNVTSSIEFKKFEIGDKVGYYICSERIREIIDVDKRKFYNVVNKLYSKDEPRNIIRKNNVSYISKYAFEILMLYFLKWNRDGANVILGKYENKYEKVKNIIDKPNSQLKPDTNKVSRRVINNRMHLSTNDICHILKVNPTRFNKEFERLYEGSMNGLESLSKDKHGNVLAFLTNQNMLSYVVEKFDYDKSGYLEVLELYKQVD